MCLLISVVVGGVVVVLFMVGVCLNRWVCMVVFWLF